MNILARILHVLNRTTPTHCRCGRPNDIYDHERPWRAWCGRCYLRKIGKL